MKKLAEVKSLFNTEKAFETATSFGINDFGKYCPNITFVLPKDFVGNPLQYRTDQPTKEMIQNMNVSFNGNSDVLFGDFWKSQKGGACFRPKNVSSAQHMLIRVDWGGAFRDSRGSWKSDIGELYFRRAASNGGGTGYDYWVFPIGFYRVINDTEIDGDSSPFVPDFSEKVKQIRAQFNQLDQELTAKAKAQVDAKVASGSAKFSFEPRLRTVNARFSALGCETLELGEISFKWSWQEKLYTEENVAQVERQVAELEVKRTEKERLRLVRESFQPQFEAFGLRVEKLGLTVGFFDDNVVRLTKDGYVVGSSFSYTDEGLVQFGKRLEELEAEATRVRGAAEALAAYNKTKAKATELGLPQDVRIWCRRGGRTNAGEGWVIGPDGQDREPSSWVNPRPRYKYEGEMIWEQILPGELVLKWSKSCSAAPHEFEVIHLPSEPLTEAQLERVQEIEDELEEAWKDARGLASGQPSPSVGAGWGLVKKVIGVETEPDDNWQQLDKKWWRCPKGHTAKIAKNATEVVCNTCRLRHQM